MSMVRRLSYLAVTGLAAVGSMVLAGNVGAADNLCIEDAAEVDESGSYVLTGDCTLAQEEFIGNVVVPQGQNVKLNLNGKTLKSESGITILNRGGLTIEGEGKVYGSNNYTVDNHGVLTINGGDYTLLTPLTKKSGPSLIANGWDLSGGMAKEEGAPEYAELTINGGTFTNGLNAVKNDERGILTINGGTFTNDSKTNNANVLNGGKDLTVTGGTFNDKIMTQAAGEVKERSVTVAGGTGGSITAADTKEHPDYFYTFKVTGGSWTGVTVPKVSMTEPAVIKDITGSSVSYQGRGDAELSNLTLKSGVTVTSPADYTVTVKDVQAGGTLNGLNASNVVATDSSFGNVQTGASARVTLNGGSYGYLQSTNNAVITLNGGQVTGANRTIYKYGEGQSSTLLAIHAYLGGKVVVNDGEILDGYMTPAAARSATSFYADGEIDINGGKVNTEVNWSVDDKGMRYGVLKVAGGEFAIYNKDLLAGVQAADAKKTVVQQGEVYIVSEPVTAEDFAISLPELDELSAAGEIAVTNGKDVEYTLEVIDGTEVVKLEDGKLTPLADGEYTVRLTTVNGYLDKDGKFAPVTVEASGTVEKVYQVDEKTTETGEKIEFDQPLMSDEDLKLSVKTATDPKIQTLKMLDGTVKEVYDVKMVKTSDESEFKVENNNIRVTLNLPAYLRKYKYHQIAYINEKGEIAERFDVLKDAAGEKISFYTTHLSWYAILASDTAFIVDPVDDGGEDATAEEIVVTEVVTVNDAGNAMGLPNTGTKEVAVAANKKSDNVITPILSGVGLVVVSALVWHRLQLLNARRMREKALQRTK